MVKQPYKWDTWQEAFEVSDADTVSDLCKRIKDKIGYNCEFKILPVFAAERTEE